MQKCFDVRRWSLTVLTVFAVSAAGSLYAEPLPDTNPPVEYDYYTSPEGTSYAAVGLRSIPVTNDIPCETVILVDTSASQKGQAREDSLETLRSALANLPAGTRVKLYALDVDADAMTPDFVEVGSPELGAALQQLQRRVPLGATDMPSGIQAAKISFNGRSPQVKRSVIYLGDGRSMARTIDTPVFKKEIEEYRNAKIPFNACTIGQNANLGLAAAFANQTGGLLVDMNAEVKKGFDKAVDDALGENKKFAEMPNFGNAAGKKLAEAAQATVVWVNADSYSFPSSWTVYPKQLQPLRSDRETIVIAKTDAAVEPFKLELNGTAPGKEVKLGWNFAPNNNPGVKNASKYLAVVANVAAKDDGLTMPIVGWEGLDTLRDGFAVNLINQLNQAERAIESGNHHSAVKLLNDVLKYDPKNATAIRLLDTAKESSQAAVAGKVGKSADEEKGLTVEAKPAAEVAPVADLVDAVKKEHSIETQKVENEVRKVVVEASGLMNTDPEIALQELKTTQAMVRDNAALSPDQRNLLLDRLGNMIKQTEHTQYLDDKKRERQAVNEGTLRERQQTLQALEENRVKAVQIFDRFDSLMSSGEYKVANQVAEEVASKMLPDDTAPFTATRLSGMAAYIYEYEQLRQRRITGFVEAMMTAERSFVPIPDEPPITYIEPEKWLILSERRKDRWSSVDLSNSGPAEKKITKALDKIIDIELDDSQTYEDLFNLIKEKNPGMNIGLDPKGAGAMGIQLSSNVVREPISYHGMKLRSVLNLILGGQDLTYVIKNEVLLITTAEEAKNYMTVKVYPFQDLVIDPTPTSGGGMGGGMMGGGMGGGMGGMMGGGGMGGGMGGMMGGGGMGGGMMGGGGMGGGMFSVPNAVRSMYGAGQLNGKAANGFNGGMFSVPSEKVPAKTAPVADNQDTEAAAKQLAKASSEAENPRDFWDNYFSGKNADDAVVKTAAARLIDQLRAKKRGKDGLQNAQALKNDAKIENQIIALTESAILNDRVQPWMYEALALSLYLIDAPKKEIERAVLSAADFCETPLDLMNIGMFANGVGLKQRAFLLYKQTLEVMPPKNEFYAATLRLAQELNDEASIRWIGLAILSVEWDGVDGGLLMRNAYDTLAGLYHRMLKEKRDEEAKVLESEVVDACRRDCIVTVQWAGDAGVDLSVREPSDSFCWFGNPRTISGGLLKVKPVDAQGVRTGALSETSGTKQISYVCPKGFNGRYTVVLHKDWGTPANNLLKVSVVTNGFTGQNVPKQSETVELDPNGTIVYFDLENGRRTEKVEEAELTEAAMRTSAAEQMIARNYAIKKLADTSVVAQIVGGGSGETSGGYGATSGGTSSRYLPFDVPSVVGYQPQIIFLPDGASLSSNAVVSADRRYVRMSPSPQFNSIRKVTPFNMATGASDASDTSGSGGGMGNSGGMGSSSSSGSSY